MNQNFSENADAVAEWQSFLNSPVGQSLRQAVAENNPLRELGGSGESDSNGLRLASALDSQTASATLGYLRGWQALENLLFQTLTDFSAPKQNKHRKLNFAEKPQAPSNTHLGH